MTGLEGRGHTRSCDCAQGWLIEPKWFNVGLWDWGGDHGGKALDFKTCGDSLGSMLGSLNVSVQLTDVVL